MNKSELVQELVAKTGLTRAEASRAVEALFSVDNGIIAGELQKGSKVQISGFGSFEAKHREARKGRNPRTGKEIDIAAASRPVFRSAKNLKDSFGPTPMDTHGPGGGGRRTSRGTRGDTHGPGRGGR